MPQPTRSPKIRSTCWRTISPLTRNITSRISFPSRWCVSSNRFLEKRPRHFVASFHYVGRSSTDNFLSVSGDHTRTIQIATPTVGGLMKFAVKRETCMGCKTLLKPGQNAIKGLCATLVPCSLHSDVITGGAVCNNCRPRLAELYQRQVRTLPILAFFYSFMSVAEYHYICVPNSIFALVDAVPTVSRIASSRRALLQ